MRLAGAAVDAGFEAYVNGNPQEAGDHLLAGPPALAFTGRAHSDIEDGKYRADAPQAA